MLPKPIIRNIKNPPMIVIHFKLLYQQDAVYRKAATNDLMCPRAACLLSQATKTLLQLPLRLSAETYQSPVFQRPKYEINLITLGGNLEPKTDLIWCSF